MSSHYYIDIVYPAALEEAFESMISMKRSIESYKLKSNANQQWIEKQENTLAKLMYFIQTSKQTFEFLQNEYSGAKKEGFRNGIAQAKKEFNHKEQYGNLRFDNRSHKEQIRAASILNAQEKWNF